MGNVVAGEVNSVRGKWARCLVFCSNLVVVINHCLSYVAGFLSRFTLGSIPIIARNVFY